MQDIQNGGGLERLVNICFFQRERRLSSIHLSEEEGFQEISFKSEIADRISKRDCTGNRQRVSWQHFPPFWKTILLLPRFGSRFSIFYGGNKVFSMAPISSVCWNWNNIYLFYLPCWHSSDNKSLSPVAPLHFAPVDLLLQIHKIHQRSFIQCHRHHHCHSW